MRRLVAAVILVILVAIALSLPAGANDRSRSLPMQFSVVREGPTDDCGDKCRIWISAIGMIKAETPREFEGFAQGRDLRGATLVLDSEGGSVLGAIALGRTIRRLGLNTTVGRTIPLVGDEANDPRAKLSPRADCESMCTFVLLAGLNRSVPLEARVRVHQIWLGDRRDDATAASYSAEDIVLVQRDIGRLVQYTAEMGGSFDLLTIALRIPPWEPMRLLSRDELRRMKLDLSTDKTVEAPVPAPVIPVATAAATNGGRITGMVGERGWSLVEQSGQTVLVRRHPLTVEGDEIGSFDLSFACGENADSYLLTYSERRMGPDVQRVPGPLKSVIVSIGQKSTGLKISSSENKTRQPERSSLASAAIPAAMITSLAAPGSRSVVVTTAGSETPTVIRLGNTGLAQNFPQLAASCAQDTSRSRSAQAGLLEKN